MTLIVKNPERMSMTIPIPSEMLSGILKAIRPEKVFCFGIRTNVSEAWSCFLRDTERETVTFYDLLILTTPDEKRPRHELLDLAECHNTKTEQVNALVHNAASVSEAVDAGSTFFETVCAKGQLLYDDENIRFKLSAEEHHPAKPAHVDEALWGKWFDLARKFLAGASHFAGRGWNDLSAFMLHQAVEHTCIALTRAITGYRPNTHNLARLIRLIHNFAPFTIPVFPRDTREEIYLFNLLSRAYSEARYKESYRITSGEIAILIERVADFQGHAERLYEKRIMHTLHTLKP